MADFVLDSSIHLIVFTLVVIFVPSPLSMERIFLESQTWFIFLTGFF